MKRLFARRKRRETEDEDGRDRAAGGSAGERRSPELPCIQTAVEKLAAEMDGAQDILGKLSAALAEDENKAEAEAEGAAAAPERAKIEVGARVLLSGLQAQPAYNGRVGTVKAYRCASLPRPAPPCAPARR